MFLPPYHSSTIRTRGTGGTSKYSQITAHSFQYLPLPVAPQPLLQMVAGTPQVHITAEERAVDSPSRSRSWASSIAGAPPGRKEEEIAGRP